MPFVDDVKSTGGNTQPSLEISPLGFFGAYTDTHHELPFLAISEDSLPNKKMDQAYTNRSDSALKKVKLVDFNYLSDLTTFELEQSPGYQFVHVEDGFAFKHDLNPVDSQWRTAFIPNYSHYQHLAKN